MTGTGPTDTSPPPARVLVVEDDELQSFLVTEALGTVGFDDVRVVTTVGEALRVLDQWEPHLVVLDLGLPDGDGMSVLELLGQGDRRGIPALVVTGDSDPDRRVRALELGAFDLVVKPFHLPELGARARRALRSHDDLEAATVVTNALAAELHETETELDGQLERALGVLLAALALRSPHLADRARRIGASVTDLATVQGLTDVAARLGRAASCSDIGAMTFTDAELTRYLDDDPDTAERAAHVSAALLAPLDRLAMVAARHRRPAGELDRPLEQLVAALTAVAHRFHAAAQRPDRRLDIKAGVRALHAPDLAHLDPALVEAFEAHCLPHDR
ncbi:MAG: hypothetical protein RLZ04_2528 [Actinomycetota bacterium]